MKYKNRRKRHYMDDVLVGINSFHEITPKWSRVLGALSECGLMLSIDKCKLFNDTISFLRHQLHASCVRPWEIKTNAIVKFPKPKIITEVRKFLGPSCNFLLAHRRTAIKATPQICKVRIGAASKTHCHATAG